MTASTPKTGKAEDANLTPEQALQRAVQQDHDEAQQPSAAQEGAGTPKPEALRARKSTARTGRSRAREFIVQALYQHLVGHNDAAAIDQFTRELTGFHKGDSAHFDAVFHGCVEHGHELDKLIEPLLDRGWKEISPIEHACMWIGVYEFKFCPDVPWRVVLNECIELAKSFGGTDGHKYVNGVLHALAPRLRAAEVEHDRSKKA